MQTIQHCRKVVYWAASSVGMLKANDLILAAFQNVVHAKFQLFYCYERNSVLSSSLIVSLSDYMVLLVVQSFSCAQLNSYKKYMWTNNVHI